MKEILKKTWLDLVLILSALILFAIDMSEVKFLFLLMAFKFLENSLTCFRIDLLNQRIELLEEVIYKNERT